MQHHIVIADLRELEVTTVPSKASRYSRTAARVLLGLLFCFAGVIQFFPQHTEGLPRAAADLSGAFARAGYLLPLLGASQALAGTLLIVNRSVPVALTILAPIVLNIVAFHLFLAPRGLVVAFIVLALELYLAFQNRKAYASLFTKGA